MKKSNDTYKLKKKKITLDPQLRKNKCILHFELTNSL